MKLKVDRPWHEYPIGTKAHSCIGGYWTRVENGWKAQSGCTFPTPGGDAVGECIELPPPHPYQLEIELMELMLAGNEQNIRYCEVEGASDASVAFFKQRGQRMQTILDLLKRQESRCVEDENENQQPTVDSLVQDT